MTAMTAVSASFINAAWLGAAVRPDPLAGLPSVAQMLVRGVLSLGVVFAVLAVFVLIMRRLARRRGGEPSAVMEVVGTSQLGASRSMHLVRVGDRFVLVGDGPDGLRTLASESLDHAGLAQELDGVAEPQPEAGTAPNPARPSPARRAAGQHPGRRIEPS